MSDVTAPSACSHAASRLLDVASLRVAFGGKEVVHGIDFRSIAAGEKLALVGESGSGKTVTALSCCGWCRTPSLRRCSALFGAAGSAGRARPAVACPSASCAASGARRSR